ncbi:methylmalonyl Co-A mutase-associated GTPase MeaB [Desulfosarcina sp. OttesenSCG-928-A07]|nr:methylmalonyl Co-A mutase-associated GTPase MeaB [Desulfosarcina sp. OttesenSCG-928-A07]
MDATSPEFYIEGVRSGNRRILAKTITLLESIRPADRHLARVVMEGLLPHTGKSIRLGITGVPGVGKSTFVERFGMVRINDGMKVAVLAIDPSSTRSGGSIMADKTRMEHLAVAEGAFIRPSPSGGTLGGAARMTRESLLVCEAAGFDLVIVETVGVGQSETTVASMVDFFLVLMLAGAGDELQGIKKGVLEMADAVVINKADGDNVEKAEQARRAYENAFHLITPESLTWHPPVLTCSALTASGFDQVWETIVDHHRRLEKTGELAQKRRQQAVSWMWSRIEDGLKERFFENPDVRSQLKEVQSAVARGDQSPTAGAEALLFLLDNGR